MKTMPFIGHHLLMINIKRSSICTTSIRLLLSEAHFSGRSGSRSGLCRCGSSRCISPTNLSTRGMFQGRTTVITHISSDTCIVNEFPSGRFLLDLLLSLVQETHRSVSGVSVMMVIRRRRLMAMMMMVRILL